MSFDSTGKFFISDEDIKAIIGSLIALLVILLIVLVVLRCNNATKRIIHNSIKHLKSQDIIVDSLDPNRHENLITFTRLDSKECARQIAGAFLDVKVNELKMVILYGPPGVGKTHAIETKLPSKKDYTVISVDASKLSEASPCEKITVMCRGESALTAQKAKERFSFIFNYAQNLVINSRYKAKVVIVFDEIIQECKNNRELCNGLQQFLINDVGSTITNKFSENIALLCIGNESLSDIIHAALPTESDENEDISTLRAICSIRPGSQHKEHVYHDALNRRMKEYAIPQQMSYDVVIYNIVFAAVSRSKWQSIKIGDHNIDLVDIRQKFDSYRELIDKASNNKIVIESGTKDYRRINSKADEIMSSVINAVRCLPDDVIKKGFDDLVDGLLCDADTFTILIRKLLDSNEVYKKGPTNITDNILKFFDDNDKEEVKNYIKHYQAIQKSLKLINYSYDTLKCIDKTIFNKSSTFNNQQVKDICDKMRLAIYDFAVNKVRAFDASEVREQCAVLEFDGIAELIYCDSDEPWLQQFQICVKSIPMLPHKALRFLSADDAVTDPLLRINDPLLDFVIKRDDGSIIGDDSKKLYLEIVQSAKDDLIDDLSSNINEQNQKLKLNCLLNAEVDCNMTSRLQKSIDDLQNLLEKLEQMKANEESTMLLTKELSEKIDGVKQDVLKEFNASISSDNILESGSDAVEKLRLIEKLCKLLGKFDCSKEIKDVNKTIQSMYKCMEYIDLCEKVFGVESKIKIMEKYCEKKITDIKAISVENTLCAATRIVDRKKFDETLDIFDCAKGLLKEHDEEMFEKIKKQILRFSIFTIEDSKNVLFMKSVVGHAAKSQALQSEQVVDISQIAITGINAFKQLHYSCQIAYDEKEAYEEIMSYVNLLKPIMNIATPSEKKEQTFMPKKVSIPTNIKVDLVEINKAHSAVYSSL